MSEPETSTPTFHAAAPTKEGWVFFYANSEMLPEDVVGAVHIRPGVDIDMARKAWSQDEIRAAQGAFDGMVGLRFGDGGQSLEAARAMMFAIELRSYLHSRGTQGAPAPSAARPNPGTGTRRTGPPPGANATERAKTPKRGSGQTRAGHSPGRRAGSPRGSQKGKDNGVLENDPIFFFAGLAKAVTDGIGELAFMAYDAAGTGIDKLSDDYEHDYISLAGRALAEQKMSPGDLIEGAIQGATDSTVNMLLGLARKDYFASGIEAAGTPLVAGMTAGTGAAGGASTLTKVGRALKKRRSGKTGIRGVGIATEEMREAAAGFGRLKAEDWGDLGRDLGLDAPGTHAGKLKGAPKMSRAEEVADAVRAAREMGWVDAEGGGLGSVGGALQRHSDAGAVRKALDLAGDQSESAHLGASVFLRGLPDYKRSRALTQLLPKPLHRGTRKTGNLRGYDPYWKRWARLQHKKLRKRITLKSAMDAEYTALEQAGKHFNPNKPLTGPGSDWMTPRRRDTLSWQMTREYLEKAAESGVSLSRRVKTPMKPRARKRK
jgi:hypothetical protein